MVKHCSHGLCTNDSRKPNAPTMKNPSGNQVFFLRFPGKKRNPEKAKRWINACRRPRDQLSISKLSYHHSICSLHFVGENGPSSEYPDPIPATASSGKRDRLGKLHHRKNSKRLAEDDVACSSLPEKLRDCKNDKTDSPECPLALLAQTCSKLKKKVLTPGCRQSNAFQLKSSTQGSLVKIAPASYRFILNDKTIPRVLCSSQKILASSLSTPEGSSKYICKVNPKQPITAAGNPKIFVLRSDLNCNNNSAIKIPSTPHAVVSNVKPLNILCDGEVSNKNDNATATDVNSMQLQNLTAQMLRAPKGKEIMEMDPGPPIE